MRGTVERADHSLIHVLRETACPLVGAPEDFEPLLRRIGNARFVLVGEASHGTHEFYRVRAEITKRLIGEKGFTAVAIEGDWPDAYRVNRHVRGQGTDADEALGDSAAFHNGCGATRRYSTSWWCGHTIPISATRGPPRWAPAAS